ncbi:HlyD family type I secretion periplasmic adaptor subunit [Paracoccus sp. TK19116]|uniref:Membrane fusion protein (MFP) family protein n=1 Tax=Paracoccus albicereus TaxID=2922394 RepID=A0ABT1MNN9_9RHOB|nr:HlyD family type I secretion periplasmic adaptor subunit [Paracoccus albicereus]MCQ0969907.1 HlyD family type I secretion periplasmic adaptor subunit [Paracoccus albicereus]
MAFASTAETATARGHDFDRFGGRILAGLVLAVGLLGGIGGWAFTAMLTGAVIAVGTVKVDQNLKEVQHRDGGIIAEIAVEEGEEVSAGQVLFRLDDAQSRSELSILSAQLADAKALRARLIADRDGGVEIDFPARLSLDETSHRDLIEAEARLHAGNIANRENQRQQLVLGIEQVEKEIVALEVQRTALTDELDLVEGSHARLIDLLGKGLVEAPRIEEIERERVQLRGRLGELDANIARSASRIGEIRMRILSIDEVARTEAQRELVVVESRIQELIDRIAAVEDRLGRTDIRAPIAGQIHEISVFTEGGVITPAEVLATIVPAGAQLRTEIQLPTASIDQVFVGQEARVRFSSFNHRTTPEVLGRITYVSPATVTGRADGQPHYIGHVELLPGEADRLGDLVLLPGMQAEVYLTTQEQSAAAYFARPLIDQFERAFREE